VPKGWNALCMTLVQIKNLGFRGPWQGDPLTLYFFLLESRQNGINVNTLQFTNDNFFRVMIIARKKKKKNEEAFLDVLRSFMSFHYARTHASPYFIFTVFLYIFRTLSIRCLCSFSE